MTARDRAEKPASDAVPFERCAADDILYDYTLRPYAPPHDPAGKLHSSSLLFHCLNASSHLAMWRQLIDALRAGLGRDRTVWGLKLAHGELAYELYFYLRPLAASAHHREPAASLPQPIFSDQILAALRRVLDVRVDIPATVPAIMVSVDIDDATLARGAVERLHVYMLSGLSYDVTAAGSEHANHYTFFEMDERDRLRALVNHLSNGLLHGSQVGFDIQKVLVPQLYSCRTVCLAAKRACEGVYFAGVDSDQLIWFVRNHGWPQTIIELLAESRPEIDHLLWDVGLDYVHGRGGVTWSKRAIYGTF